MTINRHNYEQNYLACLAEIEKRKSDGRWTANEKKATQNSLVKIKKLVRILAILQAIGGIVGIYTLITTFGTQILNSNPGISNIFIFILILIFFVATSWAGWRYWKDELDWHGLWRILLFLQIPAFSIGGFGYEFYSGFAIMVGVIGDRFVLNPMVSSCAAIVLQSEATFKITINFAAVILLVLLNHVSTSAAEA